MTLEPGALFYSLLGGVIPAFIWLAFWLREDKKRPEPRGLIMLAFFSGMVAVLFVIPFQKVSFRPDSLVLTFAFWAIFEEVFKFIAAYFTVLRRKEDDEPIDPLIYMMTVALGFAALENALFILRPLLAEGQLLAEICVNLQPAKCAFNTGSIRFVGATLLHTISSATIGISMALAFYKSRLTKVVYLVVGLVVASALHMFFNLFIIKEANSVTLATFGFVWIAVVILMLFFEKIKRIYPIKKP